MNFAAPSLVELGFTLLGAGYEFVTVTPATHARVLARKPEARTTRDVFGWSAPFRTLDPSLLAPLEAAGAVLAGDGELRRSAVRYASAEGHLFVHSAFPTLAADSVFFGPDTYRFLARLASLTGPLGRVVDVGCGGGAGGLWLADRAEAVVLADVSATALAAARTNHQLAGAPPIVSFVESDVLSGVEGRIDTVIANPPFMADPEHRLYRDGGGALGIELAVRIVEDGLARLSPGGRLLLYTGTPVIEGRDALAEALTSVRTRHRPRGWDYKTVDVDIFGEELALPAYAHAERIAAVCLTATM